MSQNAIEINNLCKSYKMFPKPIHRVLQPFSPKKYYHSINVLKDISIDIAKGEVVGIVGHNGAGKSTLLKLITGITTPTSGSIKNYGKISSLLELGTGFNSDFTGLENIYLNASFLQLSRKEVDERLDDIIEFADIGEYIYEPLKTYSSGMRARLAFAIAINVNPDILIVDEVLSVGDVFFREKCFRKFNEFKEKGITILFVTHSMQNIVNHTNRAFMLHDGEIVFEGSPKDVTNVYMEHQRKIRAEIAIQAREKNEKENQFKNSLYCRNPLFNKYSDVNGTGEVELYDIQFRNLTKNIENRHFEPDDEVEIDFFLNANKEIDNVRIHLMISLIEGKLLFGSKRNLVKLFVEKKGFRVRFKNLLNSGDYFFDFGIEMETKGGWTTLFKINSGFHYKVINSKNEGPLTVPVSLIDLGQAQREEEELRKRNEERQKKEEEKRKQEEEKRKQEEEKRKQEEEKKRLKEEDEKLRIVRINSFKDSLNYQLPILIVSFPVSGEHVIESWLNHNLEIKSKALHIFGGNDITSSFFSLRSYSVSPQFLADEVNRFIGKEFEFSKKIILKRNLYDMFIVFYESFIKRKNIRITPERFMNDVEYFYAVYNGNLGIMNRKTEIQPLNILQGYKLFSDSWLKNNNDFFVLDYDKIFCDINVQKELNGFLGVELDYSEEIVLKSLSNHSLFTHEQLLSEYHKHNLMKYESMLKIIDTYVEY